MEINKREAVIGLAGHFSVWSRQTLSKGCVSVTTSADGGGGEHCKVGKERSPGWSPEDGAAEGVIDIDDWRKSVNKFCSTIFVKFACLLDPAALFSHSREPVGTSIVSSVITSGQ